MGKDYILSRCYGEIEEGARQRTLSLRPHLLTLTSIGFVSPPPQIIANWCSLPKA